MNVNDICQLHIKNVIDENGVHPQPGAHLDRKGVLTLYAMDINAKQIIERGIEWCLDENILEIFVSLDTYALPGQGIALDSLLVIFHAHRGQAARLGTLAYSWNGGTPIVELAIDWHNKFWAAQYQTLLNKFAWVP